MAITRKDLIRKYIDFFKSKDHKEIPGASLVPSNDPTVLFTTAGMHPLVPFLLGQKHPLGKRLVNVQRCIRTGDINEVGDKVHHTFFEMMGNWSLGDYSKEEAIKMTFEFHTKILGIPVERYAVTCFKGDKVLEADKESSKVWKSLGLDEDHIVFLGKEDNFWELGTFNTPCGPCTEQFFWKDKKKVPGKFNPEDKNWVEIGNDVLMEYVKENTGKYILAKQKNIDFGGGLERTLAVLNGFDDNYLTEIWQPLIKEVEKLSGKSYKGNEKEMRIIVDHIKAAVFIINDGVYCSNSERGYVLRRLIRRAIRFGRILGLKNFIPLIGEVVFKVYNEGDLAENKERILTELEKEEIRFNLTLEQGMKIFDKIFRTNKLISGKDAFLLYQSYGFPIEMTEEIAEEKKIKVDLKEFQKENEKHQQLSKTASSGMFKSGLADNSIMTTRLHTATHLLNEALRENINKEIKQKGSNITPERLRFDFNFGRKLTEQELSKVEEWINEKIGKSLEVRREEMKLSEALKLGAHGEFGAKYPEVVSVYTILDGKKEISKEICTGPHVSNLNELGKFKIIKEESSSAGVRRIKAILEEI